MTAKLARHEPGPGIDPGILEHANARQKSFLEIESLKRQIEYQFAADPLVISTEKLRAIKDTLGNP